MDTSRKVSDLQNDGVSETEGARKEARQFCIHYRVKFLQVRALDGTYELTALGHCRSVVPACGSGEGHTDEEADGVFARQHERVRLRHLQRWLAPALSG